MKFLIVLTILFAMTYGLEPEFVAKLKEELEDVVNECKTETGVTDQEIAIMKSEKQPMTHEGKCLIACIQKKLERLDSNGKLDKARALASLDKMKDVDVDFYKKNVEIVEKCYGVVKDQSDPCETALLLITCEKQEADRLGITEDFF